MAYLSISLPHEMRLLTFSDFFLLNETILSPQGQSQEMIVYKTNCNKRKCKEKFIFLVLFLVLLFSFFNMDPSPIFYYCVESNTS